MNITSAGRRWYPEDDGQPSIEDLELCLTDCSDDMLATRREARASLRDMRRYRTTWPGRYAIDLMRDIDEALSGWEEA